MINGIKSIQSLSKHSSSHSLVILHIIHSNGFNFFTSYHKGKLVLHFTLARANNQELKELMNEPLENVTVIPDETNTQKWTVEIRGPVSTAPGRRSGALLAPISQGSNKLMNRQDHHMSEDDSPCL